MDLNNEKKILSIIDYQKASLDDTRDPSNINISEKKILTNFFVKQLHHNFRRQIINSVYGLTDDFGSNCNFKEASLLAINHNQDINNLKIDKLNFISGIFQKCRAMDLPNISYFGVTLDDDSDGNFEEYFKNDLCLEISFIKNIDLKSEAALSSFFSNQTDFDFSTLFGPELMEEFESNNGIFSVFYEKLRKIYNRSGINYIESSLQITEVPSLQIYHLYALMLFDTNVKSEKHIGF